MRAKHRRLTITAKTNKKKRAGFKFLNANHTFYLTFVLSIVFHVGILYSIPAVDLFSNNADAGSEKMIELDLLDDESLAPGDELALSEEQEHQFQAAVPNIPWNWSEDAREDEPDVDVDADSRDFAPLPKLTELKDDYTLVSEAREQKADINDALGKQRSPEELLTRPFKSKQPELEKPTVEQIRPAPPERLEKPPEDQTSSPAPLQNDSLLAREKPAEDLLNFPRPLQNLEEHQKPRLAEKKLTRPPLEKQERNLQDPPKLSVVRRDSPELQTRQLGLVRENEQDRNRFGIFAGEKFEAPGRQDAEEILETEKQDTEGPDDVTQKADTLPSESDIEGPVRGRAVVYRPRPPQIDSINVEVELRLRFWVLPDGTIGEVIPIKRGNAQLEQIAISYLKKWQFEPLTADAPQKQIWGTIPIKFTAQ